MKKEFRKEINIDIKIPSDDWVARMESKLKSHKKITDLIEGFQNELKTKLTEKEYKAFKITYRFIRIVRFIVHGFLVLGLAELLKLL